MIALLLLGISGCDKPTPSVDASACPEDLDTFEAEVWQPVLGRQCVLCHQEAGLAAGTRLVFQLEGTPNWREHNLEVARTVALLDSAEGPTILAKSADLSADGHGGGSQVTVGDTRYQALDAFVSWSRGTSCGALEALATCDGEAPGPRLLRRLSHEEYDNTVADLLGLEGGAVGFPADDVVMGFTTIASVLDVSALLIDDYREAAETLAWEADIEALLPCDPTGEAERGCAESFIRDIGLRTFRRPLSDDDVERYVRRWEAGAADADFEEGARWVLATMLQSPHFLYRLELGVEGEPGIYTLTDFEVATELSYLLWATTPDDPLLDAAAAGELSTPEGLEAQLTRMAADPRAAGRSAEFVVSWLGLDRLSTVSRDATTYPSFTTSIREDMAGETQRFVENVAESGGTYGDLLTSNQTFLTPELAAHYGVALTPDKDGGGPAADRYEPVSLRGTGRGGLLGQGSVLATFAHSTGSSPIHRGLLVREHVLCEELPEPPASLMVSTPEVEETQTTREAFASHATDPTCAVCHQLIDPIGFGFENFDGVGVWRDTDNGEAVDVSGEILYSRDADGPYEGLYGLEQKLAESPAAQACYTRMWFTWATGLSDQENVDCAADGLAGAYDAGELPLLALPRGLVASPHFTTRTDEAGYEPTPAVP